MDTVDAMPCPGIFTRNTTKLIPDLKEFKIDITDKIRFKMDHDRRGIAVIINNQTFGDDERLR